MDLRYEHFFVAAWALGCLFLVAGAISTWVYRIPGVSLGEVLEGPNGQPRHRMFHQHTDMMRLVRPEKRRLIYALQLTGATIIASLVVVPFLVQLFFPSVFE